MPRRAGSELDSGEVGMHFPESSSARRVLHSPCAQTDSSAIIIARTLAPRGNRDDAKIIYAPAEWTVGPTPRSDSPPGTLGKCIPTSPESSSDLSARRRHHHSSRLRRRIRLPGWLSATLLKAPVASPRLLLAGLGRAGGPKAFGHVRPKTGDEGARRRQRYQQGRLPANQALYIPGPDVIRAIAAEAHLSV